MEVINAFNMQLSLHVIRAMLDRLPADVGIFAHPAQVSAFHIALAHLLAEPGRKESLEESSLRSKLIRFYNQKDIFAESSLPKSEVVFIKDAQVVGRIEMLAIPIGYE